MGRVIKDFGPLEQESFFGIVGKSKTSVLLTGKRGKLYFVLKFSTWWLLPPSGNWRREEFLLEDALKIRDCINESEQMTESSTSFRIEHKFLCIAKTTSSYSVTAKAGKLHFDKKFFGWLLFPPAIGGSHEEFALKDAYKIRDGINESEQIARYRVPFLR